MNIDWLTVEQVFKDDLPIISDTAYQRIHIETGEGSELSQPRFQHKGSFCDVVSIKITGKRLTVDGNPSRWGRLDNVIGHSSLDSAVNVFNTILTDLGLPNFTKGTGLQRLQGSDNFISNGAVFKRIDLASNFSLSANPEQFLRALSMQRIERSVPRLHTNGQTVDWLSAKGTAFSMYRKAYSKAFEMDLHLLPKIKRAFGEKSPEFEYITDLIKEVKQQNTVRLEQGLKARFLQKNDLNNWGLMSEARLQEVHNEFLNIFDKLQVPEMNIHTISSKLIEQGICNGTKAAHTTAFYALEWAHGTTFDLSKSSVQTHRARLRKIGIDIAQEFDSTKYQPVTVERKAPIQISTFQLPNWYKKPQQTHLKVA